MNKTIAIFCLIIFCLNQSGYYIIYQVQRLSIQHQVRKEILAGVPDRYLKVIENNNEVKWEEPGQEFSVHGNFYDVVRIKKVDGKILIYCLSDENEDDLVRRFAKSVRHSSANETSKGLKQTFKSNIMAQPATAILAVVNTLSSIHHKYPTYVSALAYYYKEVIIPPPWQANS